MRELSALRTELAASVGPEDLAHLRKLERWGRGCTVLGYALAWLAPNPLSAALMAQGSTARWTLMMHHCGHRAYDRIPGVPRRYTGQGFAAGWRRLVDWLDWTLPEAWSYEHNFHHLHTGEPTDPDMVERVTRWLRHPRMPVLARYAAVAFFACTWKLTYNASNTFLVLKWGERRRSELSERLRTIHYAVPFNLLSPEGREFWWRCVLPYLAVRFVLLPLLFAPLGAWAVLSVLVNSLLAEVLTNVQTFFLITASHVGDDVYRFDSPARSREEFQVRQVMGTVNYSGGGDFVDFLHGWTNYQIEHHLWPDLSLLQYQRAAPRVREICHRHGVPYVREPVHRRARQLVNVVVGKARMKDWSVPRMPEAEVPRPRDG